MSILQLSGTLLAVLAASGLISYGLMRLSLRSRGSLAPLVGGTVRIKTIRGVYRSKLVRAGAEGWVLTAPLSRDAYVPFRVGESVVVEAPVAGGSILARTSIKHRDIETHELVLAPPRKMHPVERREMQRVQDPQGMTASLEGRPANLLDFAPFGARLECASGLASGERVRLDVPWMAEPIFGWVLEVLPSEGTQGRRMICRVSFEERAGIPRGTQAGSLHLA
jgi:hypothetical protein